jgi:hypothetical protein
MFSFSKENLDIRPFMKTTGMVFAISSAAAALSFWREAQHLFTRPPLWMRIVGTLSYMTFELSGCAMLCLLAILFVRRFQRR